MPKNNYNDAAFWQQKYKVTCCQPYEWICKPQDVFINLSAHLDYNCMDKVLEVGCGTSSLCKKLKIQTDARQKQVQFTCVDFSKQLIKMSKKSKIGLESANFVCADVRDLKSLNQQQFDYIFDKGCLDCLFCEDNFIKQVIKALISYYKVLKNGGKLIILSLGKPKHRTYLLRNKLIPFHVQYQIFPKTRNRQTEIFAYICTKEGLDEQNFNEEGNIMSEGQKSDHQQQKQKIKESKKEQKKSKPDGIFILEQKKERKKNQSTNDPQFILDDPQQQGQRQLKDASINKNDGKFILEDKQRLNESEDKNVSNQDKHDIKNDDENDEDHREDKQNGIKKRDEGNFILKQAQYENDFDEV